MVFGNESLAKGRGEFNNNRSECRSYSIAACTSTLKLVGCHSIVASCVPGAWYMVGMVRLI